MKGYFAEIRRAGFDIGISSGKLAKGDGRGAHAVAAGGDALEGGCRAAPRSARADVQDPRLTRRLKQRQSPDRTAPLRQVLSRRQGPEPGSSN